MVSLSTYTSLLGHRRRCGENTFIDTFKNVYLNKEVQIYNFDSSSSKLSLIYQIVH